MPKLYNQLAGSIPLPMGPPVMVNDPQVPDFGTIFMNMILGFGIGCIFKGAGHLFGKLRDLNAEAARLMSEVEESASEKIDRFLAFLKDEADPIKSVGGWQRFSS